MRWVRTVTDDEVVEKLRRFERNRRKIGAFLIAVGILCASVGAGSLLWLEREWRSSAAALKGASDAGIATAIDGTTFYVGVSTGFLCGLLFTSGMLAVGNGVGIGLWRDRRNELLLKSWKSDGLNTLE